MISWTYGVLTVDIVFSPFILEIGIYRVFAMVMYQIFLNVYIRLCFQPSMYRMYDLYYYVHPPVWVIHVHQGTCICLHIYILCILYYYIERNNKEAAPIGRQLSSKINLNLMVERLQRRHCGMYVYGQNNCVVLIMYMCSNVWCSAYVCSTDIVLL